MSGEFVARVKVSGTYRDLYDQAGLMIRADERNWIKSGIEFVNQAQNISTVVDGRAWVVVREAYFPPGTKARIGVMAAAPEGRGFPVTFEGLTLTGLHP